MTERDKITIFDALIKPFLRADSQTSEHQEDNLFALAIRQLLNSVHSRPVTMSKFYNSAK